MSVALARRATSAQTSRGETPERITWAVEQLRSAPRGRVLEIGCGNGAALALLVQRGPGRTIVGIDRSALQARRANERLRDHPEATRPQVMVMTLEEAAGHYMADPFDTVYAVNVNAFWTEPGDAFPAMGALLRPRGRAYLIYEPPAATRLHALRHAIETSCPASGLAVDAIRQTRFHRTSGLCLILTHAGRRR